MGHSYTPVIYRELAGLDYRKFEREPDELEAFIRSDEWEGVNVTIPYKRDLVPYMDELSELAGLDYRKFEREPDELEAFIRSDEWEGVNVTIPYKRDLVPYMDELSDVAQRMGNINTVHPFG